MRNLLLAATIAITSTVFADRSANRAWAERTFLRQASFSNWTNSFSPVTTVITSSYSVVTAATFSIQVLSPSLPTSPSDDSLMSPRTLELKTSGRRCFDLYIPDTNEARANLPISMKFDLEGANPQHIYGNTNEITTLPALIKFSEPTRDTLVIQRIL